MSILHPTSTMLGCAPPSSPAAIRSRRIVRMICAHTRRVPQSFFRLRVAYTCCGRRR